MTNPDQSKSRGWDYEGRVIEAMTAQDAEIMRLRKALERAGRALNRAGWIDESQAALDTLRGRHEQAASDEDDRG